MEKYSYVNEEVILRKKLRNMKIIATSLLVFMTIVFIVFKRFEGRGLVFSSIVAFAEASMVGALADWFAVVALFRHPLGLKIIPHTAIIQNNKRRIAKALSNFVVSNFFVPEIIKAKLSKSSISDKLIVYADKNKQKIAEAIAEKLPVAINTIIDDVTVETYVKQQICKKLDEMKLYPTLGNLLGFITEAGHHKPIVKGLLSATYNFIAENREKTMLVLGGINKTFTMPFIGDLIYKKILEFIATQAEEIDTNDEVEVNKLLLSVLPKLIDDMKSSEELINSGEQMKEKFINSDLFIQLEDKLVNMILEFKNSKLEDKDYLTAKVTSLLELAIKGVSENEKIKSGIDGTVVEVSVDMVSMYGDKVGALIYDTMDSWETKDMVDKLEVQVGADLQYIRINGTVIGGLAGLVIHWVSIIFA